MKKNKIKKLTDEDYAKYIQSLKDERPTKCIVNGKTVIQNKPKN